MLTLDDKSLHPAGTRRSLEDRFVVITGGSAGIGHALASKLSLEGADVVSGARRGTGGAVEHRPLDLASFESVRAFADRLIADGRPIDLLVLNAAVHVPYSKLTTGDGEELHWQVNYLSNFLLCHLLLDLCKRSEWKRVLHVSSEAHRIAGMPLVGRLGFWRRYARSKQAAMTFFLRLQELHPELSVRIASPGSVASEIHRHKRGIVAGMERGWTRPRPPEVAANEIGWLAARPIVESIYWDRGAPRVPSRLCLEPQRADELWRTSVERLATFLPRVRAPERVTNYARTFTGLGEPIRRPASLDELCTVVRTAGQEGRGVRIVGKLHSYNDGFFSRTCMVSLDRLDDVFELDPERGTVRCQGGISVGALSDYLDRRGYALRFSGNYGAQAIAGALTTGTHGFGRDGGLTSELVTAATVVLADGSVLRTEREEELRALRLSLGTLGAIAEVTLRIEPQGPCVYGIRCLPKAEFSAVQDELARHNQYLRCSPHPFHRDSVMVVTINRVDDDAPLDRVLYVNEARVGAWRAVVPAMRIPAVRALVGRVAGTGSYAAAYRVPFAPKLFIGCGIVRAHAGLTKAGAIALDRSDWLNMELAIPRDRYGEFERLFEELRPRTSPLVPSCYYGGRWVGAGSNVLLAPNHGRDVVYMDVHVDQNQRWAEPFLKRLERDAIDQCSARPHWGKAFYSTAETLRALYPPENIEAFDAAKKRLDPEGVFSNDYSRRVMGR